MTICKEDSWSQKFWYDNGKLRRRTVNPKYFNYCMTTTPYHSNFDIINQREDYNWKMENKDKQKYLVKFKKCGENSFGGIEPTPSRGLSLLQNDGSLRLMRDDKLCVQMLSLEHSKKSKLSILAECQSNSDAALQSFKYNNITGQIIWAHSENKGKMVNKKWTKLPKKCLSATPSKKSPSRFNVMFQTCSNSWTQKFWYDNGAIRRRSPKLFDYCLGASPYRSSFDDYNKKSEYSWKMSMKEKAKFHLNFRKCEETLFGRI